MRSTSSTAPEGRSLRRRASVAARSPVPRVLLLLTTMLFWGCREEVPAQAASATPEVELPAPTDAAVDAPSGGAGTGGTPVGRAEAPAGGPRATSAAAREEAVEGPAVTTERIDAFLAYQERRLELEKALWADLAAEETPGTGRGSGARMRAPGDAGVPTAASLRRLEQRAEEDAEALEAAGLTPAELESLGTLIREVLSPRQLAMELALEETVTLLEEQAERLEGSQRQELLNQVGPLKERMTTLRSLAEVRASHGDAAVEAVLSREEALLAWQDARLTTLLDPGGKEGEGQASGRR